MIKEYRYKFEELGIIPDDIGELMGFEKGNIPEPFPELIDIALNSAPEICEIRGGFKIFNQNETSIDKDTIRIEDQVFHPSKIILTQFKNADTFALFICTAGHEIMVHSKEVSANGDYLLGYVYDVIGSVAVDKATDKLQESLKMDTLETGLKISDRFSPGYCEWSVAEQQKLFKLMPENFCGVKLSESSLMSPIKSVNGIIAMGKQVKQSGYQCRWCSEKNCIYSKIKRLKKI